mmetsp:Transcript_6295/g.7246  ORF Transcript_6295/g.7246 Transcript_6295/m.7246 type:complete len:184 (-) Transcript_6295:900-1451(-)
MSEVNKGIEKDNINARERREPCKSKEHVFHRLELELQEVLAAQYQVQQLVNERNVDLSLLLSENQNVLGFLTNELPAYYDKLSQIRENMKQTNKKIKEMKAGAALMLKRSQEKALQEEHRQDFERSKDKFLAVKLASSVDPPVMDIANDSSISTSQPTVGPKSIKSKRRTKKKKPRKNLVEMG